MEKNTKIFEDPYQFENYMEKYEDELISEYIETNIDEFTEFCRDKFQDMLDEQ
jgi:hypothetical protein